MVFEINDMFLISTRIQDGSRIYYLYLTLILSFILLSKFMLNIDYLLFITICHAKVRIFILNMSFDKGMTE